jgi:hypothetical protein
MSANNTTDIEAIRAAGQNRVGLAAGTLPLFSAGQ